MFPYVEAEYIPGIGLDNSTGCNCAIVIGRGWDGVEGSCKFFGVIGSMGRQAGLLLLRG